MEWETIAPCTFAIVLLVAIFGTIVAQRWFKHREIMAMVEKGIMPEQYIQPELSPTQKQPGRIILGWGIGFSMVGLALIIGLWPVGYGWLGGSDFPLGFGPWMIVGLLPLFLGLALVIMYYIFKNGQDETESIATETPITQEDIT